MVAFVAAAALVTGGCNDDSGDDMSFDEAVESGEPCDRLFEIRNELDPDSTAVEDANEVLRSIGCYSSTSERTDL